MSAATSHIKAVGTVAVPVADQDRALEFFAGTLGFETRLDGAFGDGFRWIEVAPPGAVTTVALVARQSGDGPVDTGIRLTSDDADADHAHLRSSGVDTDPEVLRWEGVPPMFSFRDPDGNTLYVVERD